MRVDNYRCQSVFIAAPNKQPPATSNSTLSPLEQLRLRVPQQLRDLPPMKLPDWTAALRARLDEVVHKHSPRDRNKSKIHHATSNLDVPGVRFVTIFCDDTKVHTDPPFYPLIHPSYLSKYSYSHMDIYR